MGPLRLTKKPTPFVIGHRSKILKKVLVCTMESSADITEVNYSEDIQQK